MLPVFTHAGCNSGGCHGAAVGKNGFGLSLFAWVAFGTGSVAALVSGAATALGWADSRTVNVACCPPSVVWPLAAVVTRLATGSLSAMVCRSSSTPCGRENSS